MSRFDYEQSKTIEAGQGAGEPSFAALIMAAIRRADTNNYRILCGAFPLIAGELQERYNAPGGYLPGDPDVPEAIQQAWDENLDDTAIPDPETVIREAFAKLVDCPVEEVEDSAVEAFEWALREHFTITPKGAAE